MTAPEFDMNDPQQRQPEANFLDTIVGVFANPVPTLSGVVRRRPIANAFIVIIVVSIAQGLMQALSRDPDTLGDAQELAAVIQAFTILISPVFGIGFTALITGLYWLMIRILGGNGEYGAMFAGVGFASVPSILSALIGFIAIPLGSSGEALLRTRSVRRDHLDDHPIRDRRSRERPILHRTRVRRGADIHRRLNNHSVRVRGGSGSAVRPHRGRRISVEY